MSDKTTELDTLREIPFGKRPKVLLVGNGINLSFKNSTECNKMIADKWESVHSCKVPDFFSKLSFPMQVVAATNNHVNSFMEEVAEEYKNAEIEDEQKLFIGEILSSGFDAILSTNYSLEFEKTVIDNCTSRKIYNCYRRTNEENTNQKNFGIFQCTELPCENNPYLWHIHGTALRKPSMIMGHYYYGKLISEISPYVSKVIVNYSKSVKDEKSYIPKSWIDYFLIGDVYILGFNFDLSESDLWWLLCCKNLHFAESNVTMYIDDGITDEKRVMLESYGVKIPDNSHFKTGRYLDYYRHSLKEIKRKN